jgi:predicted transport protein
MKNLTYVKPEKISLKNNPELNEKWVQEKISEDPSILGLGDLILKDKERMQPKAGRLDVLLQNADSNQRYEIEIQLGQTDESHIIRTIEYWDIERKRYPQYDHTAVIVAEDITSRFLNVISLFNGFIPLVAIQLNAIKVGENISIVCTTVLNEMSLGLVDEDEESHEVTDRTYWEEQRGSKMTVSMTDNILEIIRTFAPELSLKYNKFYIGLAKNEQTNNFVIFRPQKTILRLEVRLPRSDEVETQLAGIGLDVMDYDQRWGRYRIRLSKEDVKKHSAFLAEFLGTAYNNTVL